MTGHLTDSRLANLGANAIFQAYANYQSHFHSITQRAKANFESCDWHKAQSDAHERLDLYKGTINQIVTEIQGLLDARINDRLIWVSLKAVYSGLIAGRDDWELAETFFNSVTRRIFATVGLDPQIEFLDTDFETPPTESQRPVYRSYEKAASIAALLKTVLADYPFQTAFEDLERDVQAVVAEIESCLKSLKESGNATSSPTIDRVEMIEAVFYRRKGAYLLGRMFSGNQLIPLALALLNTPQGLVIDAVLLNEEQVGILFSFTRSYFHVEVERPYDLVRFLKSLMPRKRIAEIYISIGYNKHGKTELYRDLLHHLAVSEDHFEIARGERGMVMIVFTLPSFEVVFKLIKDRFAYPKNNTRQGVMAQYNRVFQHDRAGRLVDAQEFEHLKFERSRFSEALLNELLSVAAQTVAIEGDYVIIKHAYVERRVIPLNLYVREAEEEAAKAAVIDCGNAIKDLAATDIFTGDMLLKNFGVTRHGRVVFYDYDELCSLTSCNFRKMPESTNYDEEMSSEPWFMVGEDDIFPEEFSRFLGLHGVLRDTFVDHHGDMFEVDFWQQLQARLRAGDVIDIFPYDRQKRLSDRTRLDYSFSGTAYAENFNSL